MASNNVVTVLCGPNSFSHARFVGFTVNQLRNDPLVCDLLNLSGDESAEIRDAGGDTYVEADLNDVVFEGDTVRFFRSSGTKG